MSGIGIIHGESMEAYHGSAAFGCHDLADLRPHPLLFFKKHVSKAIPPDGDTPAKAFGRYCHALALEGEDAAAKRYSEAPEGIDRRTKDGKEAWAKFLAQADGKQVITSDDRRVAWRMVEAIREKPSLCRLLDPVLGKPEVTFRVQMPLFQLQCRSDWYLDSKGMDVNLKTIDRLSDFDKQFWTLGYYRDAAFYQQVIAKATGKIPEMGFLVVEKAEPFQAVLRVPDEQSLDIGWTEVLRDLMRMKECFTTGVWPGEPDEPREVSLPDWKIKQANP